MADRIGQQLGNYTIVQHLGEGGFAEVYLGEHLYLKSQAAIKVLQTQLSSTDDTDSFLKEAQTIARLTHPNIVRVMDFGIDNKTPYLVMDYAPNGTLRQLYAKGIALPLATILPYVRQVAEALQYAHDEHIIHRDIKPENMLIGRRKEILLSDFGIALVAQSSRYQGTQDVIGTVSYMAPEQIQGKPRPASDQYSLGIVVYEWLTGERPFRGSFTEVCTQHVFAPPPLLSERAPLVTPDVERVVMKALAKDPKQRFENVLAFASALENAEHGMAGQTEIAQPSQAYNTELMQPSAALSAMPDAEKSALQQLAAQQSGAENAWTYTAPQSPDSEHGKLSTPPTPLQTFHSAGTVANTQSEIPTQLQQPAQGHAPIPAGLQASAPAAPPVQAGRNELPQQGAQFAPTQFAGPTPNRSPQPYGRPGEPAQRPPSAGNPQRAAQPQYGQQHAPQQPFMGNPQAQVPVQHPQQYGQPNQFQQNQAPPFQPSQNAVTPFSPQQGNRQNMQSAMAAQAPAPMKPAEPAAERNTYPPPQRETPPQRQQSEPTSLSNEWGFLTDLRWPLLATVVGIVLFCIVNGFHPVILDHNTTLVLVIPLFFGAAFGPWVGLLVGIGGALGCSLLYPNFDPLLQGVFNARHFIPEWWSPFLMSTVTGLAAGLSMLRKRKFPSIGSATRASMLTAIGLAVSIGLMLYRLQELRFFITVGTVALINVAVGLGLLIVYSVIARLIDTAS